MQSTGAFIRAMVFPLLAAALPLQSLRGGDLPYLDVDIHFCRSVEEREPVGEDSVFASDVGRVYCWTLVRGARQSTAITHIWSYGDTDMASVDLAIHSPRWRTWSSKNILPSWCGRWSVRVLDARGRLLAEGEFTVLPDENSQSRR